MLYGVLFNNHQHQGEKTTTTSQRGYDETRSMVLKAAAITQVSCGVCKSWLRLTITVGDAVQSFLSLLMDFLFPFSCSSLLRLSHDTQHRYTPSTSHFSSRAFKVMLSNPGDVPLVWKTGIKYIVNKPPCVYDAGD